MEKLFFKRKVSKILNFPLELISNPPIMKFFMLKAQSNFQLHTLQKYKSIGVCIAWAFVLVTVGSLFLSLWLEGRHQLHYLALKNKQHEATIANLKHSIQSEKLFLENASENPATLEWIARKQLGYVKEGEVLFCFQKQKL